MQVTWTTNVSLLSRKSKNYRNNDYVSKSKCCINSKYWTHYLSLKILAVLLEHNLHYMFQMHKRFETHSSHSSFRLLCVCVCFCFVLHDNKNHISNSSFFDQWRNCTHCLVFCDQWRQLHTLPGVLLNFPAQFIHEQFNAWVNGILG